MKGLSTAGFRRAVASRRFGRIVRGGIGYRHNDYADIPQIFLPDRPWSVREQNGAFVLLGITFGLVLGLCILSTTYWWIPIKAKLSVALGKPGRTDIRTQATSPRVDLGLRMMLSSDLATTERRISNGA